MKLLYPQIEPFNSFQLDTGSEHSVYVEQSGNPEGIPVIFLHGGPCSGTRPGHRCFFNPEIYHIILMDQRGCGFSLPFGEVNKNTTQDIIDDMERIRQHLLIEQWLLFGGSWGGTLTLLYSQQFPEKVLGMVIRGVFLARQKDLDWFAKAGANCIYPEKWQELEQSLPDAISSNIVQDLYETVFGDDEISQRRVTKAWMEWGGQVALMNDFNQQEQPEHISEKMVKQVQMELHFAYHHYFITENQIIENCHYLKNIPTIIIHGRHDLVCPIEAGMSLFKALPHAKFCVLPNAGHIASGVEMEEALVQATDEMAKLLQ